MYAGQRTLRIAAGPDEVHRQTVAQLELAAQRETRGTVPDTLHVRQSVAGSSDMSGDS
jgi:hypothetical protein